MTGVMLYLLFIFAAVYLGANDLAFWPQVVLLVSGLVVCVRVGGHIDRS